MSGLEGGAAIVVVRCDWGGVWAASRPKAFLGRFVAPPAEGFCWLCPGSLGKSWSLHLFWALPVRQRPSSKALEEWGAGAAPAGQEQQRPRGLHQ